METIERSALDAAHVETVERLRSFAAAPLPEALPASLGVLEPASHLVDSLTGLSSRAAFRSALQTVIVGVGVGGDRAVEVVVLDVEGFAEMADYLGRVRSDEVLTEVAGRIRETVPEGAVVGRIGGNTFAVCCPLLGDDVVEPSPLVCALRAAFAEAVPIRGLGGCVHLRVSVGSASVADRTTRPEDAIAAARCRPPARA